MLGLEGTTNLPRYIRLSAHRIPHVSSIGADCLLSMRSHFSGMPKE